MRRREFISLVGGVAVAWPAIRANFSRVCASVTRVDATSRAASLDQLVSDSDQIIGDDEAKRFGGFDLMINSNLVACSTGISAGFAPLRMLSTISAARPNNAGGCESDLTDARGAHVIPDQISRL